MHGRTLGHSGPGSPHALDISVLESAFQVQDRYGLSFWDSLIVGAAAASGCRRLLTEDLTDGQELAGVLVVNPFAHAPEDVLRS